MMSPVVGSEPRSIQFFREKVHCVEVKLKKFSFGPLISSLSGGSEVLLGLVSLVSAATMFVFYKARMYMPVSIIRKARWEKSGAGNEALRLMRDSAKVIAMGLLKSVPGIGNGSTYWIYMLQDQLAQTVKQKDSELKAKDEALNAKNEELKAKDEALKAKDEALESKFKELVDMTGKITGFEKELKTKTIEFEKQTTVVSTLEKELVGKNAVVNQLEDSIGGKDKEISLLGKQVEQAIKKTKSLEEKIASLTTENARLEALNTQLSFASATARREKSSSPVEAEKESATEERTPSNASVSSSHTRSSRARVPSLSTRSLRNHTVGTPPQSPNHR